MDGLRLSGVQALNLPIGIPGVLASSKPENGYTVVTDAAVLRQEPRRTQPQANRRTVAGL